MRGQSDACERWARIEFAVGAGRGRWSVRALVVERFGGKLRGLLGTRPGDARAMPLLLVGCPSVHTFGMRYPLDVALVDGEGLVLGSWRALPPGRIVRRAGARHALERPSGADPWPSEGDLVELMDVWHVMGGQDGQDS